MSAFENRLVFACNQVGEAASEILEWIDQNRELVGTERVSLLHEFYATEVAADRLATAVNQVPSVAFVGPSRSGKTQAITAMIERGNGRLAMRFDGIRESIDYVKQIAPDGKNGLSMVVRLSGKSKQVPQNFPIALRLVSLADVIKILGSAYFAATTARSAVPSLAQVKRAHEDALERVGTTPVAGLEEADVWEIRAYFATRFGDEPLFRALSAAGFWQSLAKLAPHLENDARGKLLALLWGNLKPFTRTFVTLADVLASLEGSLEANCALDSILSLDPRTGKFSRRPDSVISGETVLRLGQPDHDTVVVCNEFGHWISVPRACLAALAAEVRLPIPGWQNEVLEKADILEFPGIDHRDSVPGLSRALNTDSTLLGRLFLRAKAVYLLDSNATDHKITSMVVCVDPTARQIGELSSLVASWVETSHGRDAVAREQQDNTLFIALTKIDKDFVEAQRPGKERRVDVGERIENILRDGFGRDYTWAHEWTPGRPFENVLLIRNPNHKAKQICDYASDGRETAFKPGQLERIERARRDFMASPFVESHIADPAGVWNEAFLLNDGGVSFLAQSIAAVCDTRVKQRQIVNALTDLRQVMRDRLQRYYVSDNYAFQHDRRRTTGLLVMRRLKACAANRRFGHLLRALQLSDAEFADVLANLDIWTAPPPIGAEPQPNAALETPEAGSETATEPKPTNVGGKDHPQPMPAASLARTAIDHWIETVRAIPASVAAPRGYHMPRNALVNLVDEIIAGANRLKLDKKVASHIEQVTEGETDTEDRIAKAALCISNAVGDYVMTLGYNDVMLNSHPRRKGREQKPIFPPRNAVGLAAIEDGSDLDKEFQADWSHAFMTLIDDNATGLREQEINDEQNRRLGRLLRLLDVTL